MSTELRPFDIELKLSINISVTSISQYYIIDYQTYTHVTESIRAFLKDGFELTIVNE